MKIPLWTAIAIDKFKDHGTFFSDISTVNKVKFEEFSGSYNFQVIHKKYFEAMINLEELTIDANAWDDLEKAFYLRNKRR